MAKTSATTVKELLVELPDDRRRVISAVRDVVVKNLPSGYHEGIGHGMITYAIPLERYPNTYNGQPLMYAALAAQKNHYALYLMCVYGSSERQGWLATEFRKAGKKLDMGKACVRFKKLDDLPLDVIGKCIAATTPGKYIEGYEKVKPPAGQAKKAAAKTKAKTAARAAKTKK
jgi:hypothetical protein